MASDNIAVSNTTDIFVPSIGRIDRPQRRFWAAMEIAAITIATMRIDWINRTIVWMLRKKDVNTD